MPVRRTNKNPNYLIISGWDFLYFAANRPRVPYWFRSVAEIPKVFIYTSYGYQCQSYSLDENDDHLVRASNVAHIPPKQVLY